MTVWFFVALVGSAVTLVIGVSAVVMLLAAQDWPHDTSRHTGWEERE